MLKRFASFANKYPLVIAAVLIYGYYLITSYDVFHRSTSQKLSFFDFVLEYDSLLWMWIAAYVFVKLQQAKEKHFGEQQSRVLMQTQLDKAAIGSKILSEVTAQLQDAINNPLAIIKLMSEDIRKRFLTDPEILRRIDQIDASLRRVHDAIKDVSLYQSHQLLESIQPQTGQGQ